MSSGLFINNVIDKLFVYKSDRLFHCITLTQPLLRRISFKQWLCLFYYMAAPHGS